MADGYIFKPPPPPPPKAAPNTPDQYASQRGNVRGGRGRGRGRGGDRGRGGHRGGFQQQRPPPPAPPVPNVHLNPAFFRTPTTATPAVPAPLQPLTVPITNLFYSAPVSYDDVAPPRAVQSYSNFSAPPPPKRQKIETRPDMSHEEWIAINGGKLIGTDMMPPQTEEEVAEWIAERKKRYPTALTKARKAVEEAREKRREKERREQKLKEEAEERERKQEERRKREEEEQARRDAGGGSDSDAAPEEVSVKARTVMRDDRKKNPPPRKICRTFQETGRCSRGSKCFYEHVAKGQTGHAAKKKKETQQEARGRKSLYARFVENEIQHENELMVKFIRYLDENGVLKDW